MTDPELFVYPVSPYMSQYGMYRSAYINADNEPDAEGYLQRMLSYVTADYPPFAETPKARAKLDPLYEIAVCLKIACVIAVVVIPILVHVL